MEPSDDLKRFHPDGKLLYREGKFFRDSIDVEKRTVELSFASEFPVERYWGVEILDHDPESVDLSRINDDAPLFFQHWEHIGVVEKATVRIGEDKKSRGTVRFSKSVRAEEKFQDVQDGILVKTSVGYKITEVIKEEREDGKKPVYRVKWRPEEITLTPMPADPTGGVGREEGLTKPPHAGEKEIPMGGKEEQRTSPETPPVAPVPVAAVAEPDLSGVKDEARKAEADRVDRILALGDKYKHIEGSNELARKAVKENTPFEGFRETLYDELSKNPDSPISKAADPSIGMDRSQIEDYRFTRLLAAMADPNNHKRQDAAKLELEASDAFAKQVEVTPRGRMIPAEVLIGSLADPFGRRENRDLSSGIDSAGGFTIATDLKSGSFIEMLRNRAVAMQLATILPGLVGNVAIPKQTGGATGYWVKDGENPTESQQTIGQVSAIPKNVGAYTDMTRGLLMQSSIGVEAFVRGDLAQTIGLALDLGAFKGSGIDGEPMGVLNTSGIGNSDIGTNGGAPTWASIVGMETDVAVANADVGGLAYVTNAKVRGKLKTTVKVASTDSMMLWDDRAGNRVPINGYPVHITNQIPSDLTKGNSTGVCSAMIFGNWADLVIFMWAGLDVLVDPYAGGLAGTVRIRVLQSADIGLRHAASFSAAKDYLTT